MHAPPAHSRGPGTSPAKSHDDSAVTTSSKSMMIDARLAGTRASPICTIMLLPASTTPSPITMSATVGSCAAAGGAGIGSNSVTSDATSAAPPKITAVRISGFIAGKVRVTLTTSTLLIAKPMPPIRPAHSARSAGSGMPSSGDQSIVTAPASDSSESAASARVRRS